MTLPEAPTAPAEPSRPARPTSLVGAYRWIGLGAAVLIAATTPAWRLDRRTWRVTLPGLPHDGERPVTTTIFIISVVLLAVAWIGMVSRVENSRAPERERLRAVVGTCALWFVPILLGPPLLSSDVYSYGAEGEMVTKGLDPTKDDMFRLVSGDFLAMTDPVWRTPVERGRTGAAGNPYGPVQMGLAALVVSASGHNPAVSAFLFKLVAVAFLALAGWGICDIARRHGVSPPVALALAVGNPLVAIHIVGGAHNDVVLLGLLVSGIALAERDHWRLGLLLLSFAALVKLPAAAGIVFVAWNRPGVAAALRERVRATARALVSAVAITVVACLVVGISAGWLNAMRNTGSTKGTLSLTTQLGYVTGDALSLVRLGTSTDSFVSVFRLLGLAVAAVISFALLWSSPRIGAERALGLCLLAVMLLGPVVWPWYLVPVFALLFAVGVGRWRPSLVVMTAVFAGEVLPSGQNSRPVLESQHLVSLLVILTIAFAALAAPWISEWWRSFRPADASPAPEPVP